MKRLPPRLSFECLHLDLEKENLKPGPKPERFSAYTRSPHQFHFVLDGLPNAEK